MSNTMKEIRGVWWDYLSIFGSQVLSVPLSLIYISFLTRHLGPSGWGTVVIFMSIVQFIFSWGINWGSNAIIRFGKEEFIRDGHLRKTFSVRLVFIFIALALSSLLLGLFKNEIIHYSGLPLSMFSIIIVMLFVYTLADLLSWILKAVGMMKHFAASSLVRQLSLVIFISLFLFLPFTLSAQVAVIMEIMSYLIVAVFCMFFLKFEYFFPFEIDILYLKKVFVYSWPLILIFLFGYFSDWMDVYFIKHYLSLRYVGIYQAAYRLMLYINAPLMVLVTLVFPVLMAVKTNNRNDVIVLYMKKIIPQVSLSWSIIVSVMIVASSFMIRLIFGSEFNEAVVPLMTLLLGVGFQVLAVMYASIFSVFDRLHYSTLITVIMCVINFMGDFILIPKIGITGAAVSTAVSYVVSSILYMVVANRIMSVSAHKAVYYPILVVVSFMFCLAIKSSVLRLLFLSASFVVLLSVVKSFKFFNIEETVFMEKIDIPQFFKKIIRWVYLKLS